MKLTLFTLLLLLAPVVHAQHAFQRASCPDNSIQLCIDGARDGDTILVEPGVYHESLEFRGKAIHVVGLQGPTRTVIDATDLGSPAVRFHELEGPDSWLQGFTIRGGQAGRSTPGGGISCCDLDRSSASARPRITDCIIRDNRSSGGGGGVFGEAQLERCVVMNNSADLGDGGGVQGALILRQCVLANNSAVLGQGGGLDVPQGMVRVEDSLVQGNVSLQSGRGGGVHVAPGAVLRLERSVLAANFADASGFVSGLGGALYADTGSRVVLRHCTVFENRAMAAKIGLGEGALSGPFGMEDSIVWGNDPPVDYSASTSISYSLVEGGAAGVGVIDADPLFVDAAERDLHLAPGSPAIDSGHPEHLDPDGTLADLGAFPFRNLYARSNAGPEHFEFPGWSELSAWIGGVQHLRLNAGPRYAGERYAIFGLIQGQRMELFLGNLDGNGRADVTTHLDPPASLTFQGLTLRSAALVLDPVSILSTNLEPLVVVP